MNELVPFRATEQNTFDYYRKVYQVPTFSRLSIQTIDISAYPEQIKMMEGFLSRLRDELYALQEAKLGKGLNEIEKLEARALSDISHMVREFNADLNAVNGLADRYPILTQNRGRALKT